MLWYVTMVWPQKLAKLIRFISSLCLFLFFMWFWNHDLDDFSTKMKELHWPFHCPTSCHVISKWIRCCYQHPVGSQLFTFLIGKWMIHSDKSLYSRCASQKYVLLPFFLTICKANCVFKYVGSMKDANGIV